MKRVHYILTLLAMLSLTIAAVPTKANSSPVVMTVTLSEFKFFPKILVLKSHTSYVLRFSNVGSSPHDFMAPEFFKASERGSGTRVVNGRVQVDQGKVVDVVITSGAAGIFPVHCSYTGHSFMGMKGQIQVQ